MSCLEKVGFECLKSHFLKVERLARPGSWAGSAAMIPEVFMTGWYDVRLGRGPAGAGCRRWAWRVRRPRYRQAVLWLRSSGLLEGGSVRRR